MTLSDILQFMGRTPLALGAVALAIAFFVGLIWGHSWARVRFVERPVAAPVVKTYVLRNGRVVKRDARTGGFCS